MVRPIHVLLAAVALAAVPTPARAVDKFIDLLRYLPATVNAVVVCDVQDLYGSPLGMREKWSATSPIGFPAGIHQLVLAGRLHPDTLQVNGEEYGMAYLKAKLTIDDIALRETGARDTIAALPAVLSPRNAYFVEFRPWTIGITTPADRQGTTQWVKFARNNPRVSLSPFLTASTVNTDPKTQFVMALDLADAIHPQEVRARLAESPAIAGKGANLDALSKLLATIQGMRLEVSVGADIRAELRVEFEHEVGPFAALALPLLQEVLSRRGAAVDEVADWTATVTGKTAVFRGPMSVKAFRRVATLLQPPAPSVGTGEEGAHLAADLKKLASQHYLTMVTTYLDDLKKPTRQAKKNFESYALWHETFAQKIAQLPPYNVDEGLLKYGYGVAERIRAIAASLRGNVVDVTALEKKISYGVSAGMAPGWGWRSQPYVYVNTNQAQIRTQQQEVIDKGESGRQEIWKAIDSATADVRSQMERRYGAGS